MPKYFGTKRGYGIQTKSKRKEHTRTIEMGGIEKAHKRSPPLQHFGGMRQGGIRTANDTFGLLRTLTFDLALWARRDPGGRGLLVVVRDTEGNLGHWG